MKKSVLIGGLFVFLLFAFVLVNVNAAACDLDISLVNQDPYPATPGEYVKLVFQIDGVENPECGKVKFELLEKYPISFDPSEESSISIESGTFNKDYSSFLLAPYKVRIDENALDGSNPVEIQYKFGDNLGYETKQFDIEVEDTRADFEVHVKNYNTVTKIITFEILNIAESDIEALTVEIPKQENIVVKGSNINIVGDLDSNDYTTADFEAAPLEGEIELVLSYSDKINERRIVEKTVSFEPEYFENRVGDEKKSGFGIIVWVIIIGGVVYYFWRRNKKKKDLQKKLRK